MTRQDVYKHLQQMFGCLTPCRTADKTGAGIANENFSAIRIDDLMQDNFAYLDRYDFTGCEPAHDIDMEEWAQEFDEPNQQALAASYANGDIHIAHFETDSELMDVMIWL